MKRVLILTKKETESLKNIGFVTIKRDKVSFNIYLKDIEKGSVDIPKIKMDYNIIDPLEGKNNFVLTHKESKTLKIKGEVGINKWGNEYIVKINEITGDKEIFIRNPYYKSEIMLYDER